MNRKLFRPHILWKGRLELYFLTLFGIPHRNYIHVYGRNFLRHTIAAKYSNSVTVQYFWLLCSFWKKYATGCFKSSFPIFVKIPPTATLVASQCIVKGLLKFGFINTGAVVKEFFNFYKLSVPACHDNISPHLSR